MSIAALLEGAVRCLEEETDAFLGVLASCLAFRKVDFFIVVSRPLFVRVQQGIDLNAPASLIEVPLVTLPFESFGHRVHYRIQRGLLSYQVSDYLGVLQRL